MVVSELFPVGYIPYAIAFGSIGGDFGERHRQRRETECW